MTIYYDPKITQAFVGAYMSNQYGFGTSNPYGGAGSDTALSVTVYSGVQPTVSDFIANWATTYWNTYLAHWSSMPWQGAPSSPNTQSSTYAIITPPPPAVANASGTAAWGVLWSRPWSSFTTTFPNPAGFMLGPVGLIGSNAVFRLSSLSITSGNSVELPDGSFIITMPSIV